MLSGVIVRKIMVVNMAADVVRVMDRADCLRVIRSTLLSSTPR